MTADVAYAGAQQLRNLADYLAQMTRASNDTGWHTSNMVVSCGEAEGEEIVVGVRWVSDAYVAEIR